MSARAPRAESSFWLLLVAGTLVAACSTTGALKTAARDTLASSNKCPAEQVQVEELGDSRYRATGCGTTETYVCKVAEHAVTSCLPESSVTPLGEPPR